MAAVALLGFAFHGYYGNAHEEAELKEEQREAAQKKLEGHFHALSKKYFDKIESEKFDPNNFDIPPPSSVFTEKEIEFMKRMQPTYFKAVDKTFHAAWENEKKTAEVTDRLGNRVERQDNQSIVRYDVWNCGVKDRHHRQTSECN